MESTMASRKFSSFSFCLRVNGLIFFSRLFFPSNISRGLALARAFLAETLFAGFALAAFFEETFFFLGVAIIQKAVAAATAGKKGGLIKNNSQSAQGEIWTNLKTVCSRFFAR